MNHFGGFFNGKKILVTGNTGFKGSWLSHILLGLGASVVGYSLPPDSTPNLYSILNLEKRMKTYFDDIRDYQNLLNAIGAEKPEMVFHLAAQPLVRRSYDEPIYTFGTNVMGTANVLEAIKAAGWIKSALIITTDKVYDNPGRGRAFKESDPLGGHDPYSASKACAELVTQAYIRSFFVPEQYGRKNNTLVASARAGNVVGGGDWSKDRIIPDTVRSVYENGEKLILRNPEAVRPWQHVLEPVCGYLLLAKMLYKGRSDLSGAWNFAPQRQNSIKVEALVKKSIKLAGRGEFEVKSDSGKPEMKTLLLDASKAKEHLGWKPLLDIDQTLEWTFGWYRNYYGKNDMAKFTDEQVDSFMKSCGYAF